MSKLELRHNYWSYGIVDKKAPVMGVVIRDGQVENVLVGSERWVRREAGRVDLVQDLRS